MKLKIANADAVDQQKKPRIEDERAKKKKNAIKGAERAKVVKDAVEDARLATEEATRAAENAQYSPAIYGKKRKAVHVDERECNENNKKRKKKSSKL